MEADRQLVEGQRLAGFAAEGGCSFLLPVDCLAQRSRISSCRRATASCKPQPVPANTVEINLNSVANSLQNFGPFDGPKWHHHYRLVFLNACDTANNDIWAHAFGIPDRITVSDCVVNDVNPQAYIGWAGEPFSPVTDQDFYDVAATYAVFWDEWMSEEYRFQDCVHDASNPSLAFPLGKKFIRHYTKFPYFRIDAANYYLRIYGYAFIMRKGYATPALDWSPYYR